LAAKDKLRLQYHRYLHLQGCALDAKQASNAQGALERTEKWNLKQDPKIDVAVLREEAKAKIPGLDDTFESKCTQKYNALVLDAPVCTATDECNKLTETPDVTPEEVAAFRKQYEAWGGDNRLTMWQWAKTVGRDIQHAALVVVYNDNCGPAPDEELHRSKVLLKAFEKEMGFYMTPGYPEFELRTRGLQGFCRWMNPTPRP